MPALLSGQRIPHTFHPYSQTNSNSSRTPLHARTDRVTHAPCCVRVKAHDTPSDRSACAAALAYVPDPNKAYMTKATNSLPKVQPSPTQQQELQYLQPYCSGSSLTASAPGVAPHLPRATTSPSGIQNSSQLNRPSPFQKLAPQTTRNPSSRSAQAIVRYLKMWRAPAEYYARRRFQHPSLLYPSRRPTLPSLLEECVTKDGNLVLVCPELAMSTSLRAYQRKIFPAQITKAQGARQYPASQGFDEDSEEEEDMESDLSDEDESMSSEDDYEEAVTPINSPPSTSTHYLQPLILTKPPGC